MTKLFFGIIEAPESEKSTDTVDTFSFPAIKGKEARFLDSMLNSLIKGHQTRGLKPPLKNQAKEMVLSALITAVFDGSREPFWKFSDDSKLRFPLANFDGNLDNFLVALTNAEAEADKGQGAAEDSQVIQDGDSKNQVSMTFEPGSGPAELAQVEGQQEAGQDLHKVAEEPVAEAEQEEESEMDRMERELREGSGVNSQG